MRAIAILVVSATAACYKPASNECAYQCNATSGCPAGLACNGSGFCVEPGSTTVCEPGDGGNDGADRDTTGIDADMPDAPAATRLYTKLAVGAHHACAIDTMGRMWCWGLNDSRQLGVVTIEDYAATPLHVLPGMMDGAWTAVSAGAYHTCALWNPTGVSAPELWCWGQNFSYQTGTAAGSTTTPHRVAEVTDHVWKRLASGGGFTCAVLENTTVQADTIMCFGDNALGQLGTAGGGMRQNPLAVDLSQVSPATTRWRSLTAGWDHACAIADDGKAYCWGDNDFGQAGQINVPMLVQARVVQGGFLFDKLDAGDHFSCGIDVSTRTLRCWGRNGARELGNGGTTPTSMPTAVIDQGLAAKWKDVSLGLYSACGIQGPAGSTDALGTVRCWGDNDFGQRADMTFDTPNTGPTNGVVDLAFTVGAGHEFNCAITGDPVAGGRVKCWGDNADGQIGTGAAVDHRKPIRIGEGVRGIDSWLAVAAGARHTCAILSGATVADRKLYCWGEASFGQIDGTPNPLPRRAPVRVALGDGATDVVVGSSHTCVRVADGTTRCWGSDQGYQLGVANNQEPGPVTVFDTTSTFVPTTIFGAGNVTCGRGSITQCWGSPQINNPYYVDNDTPWTVSLTGGAAPNASFSVGPSSGCWIEGAQTLCFGTNSFGQLGWGMASTPTMHPQPVFMLTDATALSRGPSNHRCAITTNRVVKCWGDNGFNQAGVSGGVDQYGPATVQQPNQYDEVATGLNHTCARNGGSIYCWGNNDQYQRTAIPSINSLPPMTVVPPVGETQPTYIQLASGEFHTCAISAAGALYCWGASRWGQIGDNTSSEAQAIDVIDGTP